MLKPHWLKSSHVTGIVNAHCKLLLTYHCNMNANESRVTWATSVPILVFLGLSVLGLGPMYVTDRQTDRCPSCYHQIHQWLTGCRLIDFTELWLLLYIDMRNRFTGNISCIFELSHSYFNFVMCLHVTLTFYDISISWHITDKITYLTVCDLTLYFLLPYQSESLRPETKSKSCLGFALDVASYKRSLSLLKNLCLIVYGCCQIIKIGILIH